MVFDGLSSTSMPSPERCIFKPVIFDHIWCRHGHWRIQGGQSGYAHHGFMERPGPRLQKELLKVGES